MLRKTHQRPSNAIAMKCASRPDLRTAQRLLRLRSGLEGPTCSRTSDSIHIVREVANGLDQPSFLVVELIVIRPVLQKLWQESQQPVFVHDQELLDLERFVRIGGEDLAESACHCAPCCASYLEDVESLILYHTSIILQLPHDKLQIVSRIDISRHDFVELPIEQYFAKQLDALPLGDVAL